MSDLPEPPWRRGKPARRQLSTELIVSTALAVMAKEGLDAVSMRRVAQELGTGPASLYAHVRNKDELHELMYEQIMSGIEVPEIDPARWQEQLKEIARNLTMVLIANPGAARIAMHTLIPTSPRMLLGMDRILGLMRAGGLPDKLADYAADAIALYTTAIAYEASLWQDLEGGMAEAERRIAQMDEYLAMLPPDQLVHLRALRPAMRADDAMERFEFALDLLIGGLDRFVTKPASG
ncbi:TetR/AcrR family transcriptional regulator [Fodinicola acaciae]|uniref:TetR/AcrR family transcriptional regulator n=1 Tax=Fodinicola acaciae TaxID=2681555 RepID=UPI001C9E6568|nr:TetR/AcrR family transcriptional regulator [Fodinicola acaciae]